jgi:elongator complex protein 3
LEYIKRGHTVEQFYDAIKLLRDAGFKVDLHFMPDLPGSTPEHDVDMYAFLFEEPRLRPDMVKIYPCTVIQSAELSGWYESGKYTPYTEQELFDALLQMKLLTPRYCRISRLIRDIPSDEVTAGNKITNLREILSKKLEEDGSICVCLRCREIGRQKKNIPADTVPQLFVDTYETEGGTEYFLSFEDPNRVAVFGFLRLRIPEHNNDSKKMAKLFELLPEIKGAAFIRELHTYGQMVGIGEKNEKATQHKGLGKRLVLEAEKIVKERKIHTLAIISGVGVRDYYRKLNYKKQGTYMVKMF